MKPLRIIFMGTPDFAVPALKALYEAGHEIVCVYTQPPRPKGRGQKVRNSPVHEYGLSKNIPVFHPVSFKKTQEQEVFRTHKADVAVVAAYGLILPKAVLDAPKHGCINIHASLLPRWRGASPIQHSIWKGDTGTGVTLMQMNEGLDTGPMIAKRAVALTAQTTTPLLHDRLAMLGGEMIVKALQELGEKGSLPSTPQNDADATYAPLLTKEDGRVDWAQSAAEIDRQIRALNPWPGVWSILNGKRFKIVEAHVSDNISADSGGTVLGIEGSIACGNSHTLHITKIQPENAKPMDFIAAVNGHHFKTGDIFS